MARHLKSLRFKIIFMIEKLPIYKGRIYLKAIRISWNNVEN